MSAHSNLPIPEQLPIAPQLLARYVEVLEANRKYFKGWQPTAFGLYSRSDELVFWALRLFAAWEHEGLNRPVFTPDEQARQLAEVADDKRAYAMMEATMELVRQLHQHFYPEVYRG